MSSEPKTEEIPQFNIVVTGHRGVGKTAFIKMLVANERVHKYAPTPANSDPLSVVFHTTSGFMKFNIQEIATNEPDCLNKHVKKADGLVIIYGATSHDVQGADPHWESTFGGVTDIPIALCRNKMDLEERPMKPDTTRYSSLENRNYYAFSAKTGKNVHMPFVWLAQKFKGDNNLMFVEEPAVQPPECIIDEETRQKLEKEIDAWARAQLLPDDDFDDSRVWSWLRLYSVIVESVVVGVVAEDMIL